MKYLSKSSTILPKAFRSCLLFFVTGTVTFSALIPSVKALSDCQQRVFDLDIAWFNCEAECPPVDISSQSTSASASGASDDYPIKLPAITDATKLAEAIDAHIRNTKPNSPMNGMGRYFVQGGMRSGINPLLVVAHAQQESGFGTADTKFNAAGAHNAFGRTASAQQPGVDTGRRWYKWDSWQSSLYSAAFPASGKIGQPDDQFQYIARVYKDNLNNGLRVYLEGDRARDLPGYAPSSDGNDVTGYAKAITDISSAIAQASGGAVDLSHYGTVSSDPNSAPADPEAAAVDAAKTVVALDPGHGSIVAEYTDPITGLGDRETDNSPEREDVQEVANQAKARLEQAGYKVVMLKTNAADAVSKRQRVDAAVAAKADIAVSIHTDSGSGTFEGWAEVWPQFVGGYRQAANDPSKKVTFSNEETAALSDTYSDIFAKERDISERGGTGITRKSVSQDLYFAQSRGLPSFGNLSLVQLWADSIPWIYNEAGAAPSGLTPEQKNAYAEGVVNSVLASIPANQGSTAVDNGECQGSFIDGAPQGNGDAAMTALRYSWPNYRGSKTAAAREMKPEYRDAINFAKKVGYYIGGISYPGVDCGGFVTRVMIDSGFEPGYNNTGLARAGAGATPTQLAWVRKNWQSLGRGSNLSTADLQPGDVAFRVTSSGSNDGHTFMYVGQQANFGSNIASASLDSRAPVAGRESITANNIEWFRKK